MAGFEYGPAYVEPGDTVAEYSVPDEVQALDGKFVTVTGFMLPIDLTTEGVSEFLLMKDQTLCCFGVVPRMNDYVFVAVAEGERSEYIPDFPVKVTGTFEVGRERRAEDEIETLYRMRATKIDVPKEHGEVKDDVADLQGRLRRNAPLDNTWK